MSVKGMTEVLGGPRVLGDAPTSDAELVRVIRRGLPYAAFEAATAYLQVSEAEVSGPLRLAPRTLARRKKQARLLPEESERVLRLVRVYDRAVEVLGEPEKALRWLRKPNRALAGESPLMLLDTDIGTRAVEAVLGRIEHGVFS